MIKISQVLLLLLSLIATTGFAQRNVNDIRIQKTEWANQWYQKKAVFAEADPNALKNDFEVLVMEYENLDSVRKNDKLEFGVVLPEDIRARIWAYVDRDKVAGKINPFDPQEISVEAKFYSIDESGKQIVERVYGFFYEEYRRKSDLKGWSKVKDINNADFRVRFAPKNTGLSKCEVTVHLPDENRFLRTKEFFFKVRDTGLPGFVKISDNKRYFELEGDLFLPVGSNLPAQGTLGSGYRTNGASVEEYYGYHSNIDDLKRNGANYFRMMFTPWTIEIEFEELGNYTDRLSRAWEMDQVVEHIEDIDLRMHLCMTYTTPLTYTGVFSLFRWDWTNPQDTFLHCKVLNGWFPDDPGYCYHSDAEHGVQTIDEFLTDRELMRYYQNRIRYIVSRWGYSTHIVGLELVNEINFSGVRYGIGDDCSVHPEIYEYKPYFNDTSYVRKLCNWQIEMGRYMKEDLELKDHLVCVSYGGAPNYIPASNYHFDYEDGISLMAHDSTYFSDYIDIMSYNDYYSRCEKFEYQFRDYKRLKALDRELHGRNNLNEKPLIYSEMGMGRHGCDNQFTYRQMMIMSAFTGAAGPGLAWRYNNNDPEYDNTEQRERAWSAMNVVSNFFEDVPLNKGAWFPGFDLRSDKKSEMLYLRNSESSATKAVAVISNRTVNNYSMRESWCDENPTLCDCYKSEEVLSYYPEAYQTATTVAWNDGRGVGGSQLLKVEGMAYTNKYRIAFYDGLTGEFVQEITKWSDAFGRLKIKYPELADTPEAPVGGANGSMLLVKIWKFEEVKFNEITE